MDFHSIASSIPFPHGQIGHEATICKTRVEHDIYWITLGLVSFSVNSQNPPIKIVRKFLHLLDQSNVDFEEELGKYVIRFKHRNIRPRMRAPILFQVNKWRLINYSKWPIYKGKLNSPHALIWKLELDKASAMHKWSQWQPLLRDHHKSTGVLST